MWTFILTSVILLSCGYVSQAQILSSTQPIPWSLRESVKGVEKLSIDCPGNLKIDDLSPSHCSACFGVIPKGTGTYSLFYSPRNGASLDYDKANLYTFSMICDEGGGIKTNGTVVLNVEPNFPPYFQDSSSSSTVTTSTKTGEEVYDPKPYKPDLENDQLTFTLEENPNNGFFTIDDKGIVRAKKNLNTFCKSETVTITMQDSSNPPVSKTVTLDPESNTKPTLTVWNRIMTIPENTVLELPITDNLGTQGTCAVTVVPPEYSSYIDSTTNCPESSLSSIRTPVGGKTFNYEVDPPINISFVLDNGNCPSDPRWLYLQWSDVPEPPKLTLDKMDFITKEGFVEIEPDYLIEDDDIQDKHVFSFAKPPQNPNFKIDPDSGRIYTQKYYRWNCLYDEEEFTFEVQVTDQNGNVSEKPPVKVKLNLTDVNDNRPRFTRRFDPTPIPYVDCVQPTVVVSLSEYDVTDDDCEMTTNKAVEFVEASSGSLSISKDGVVRLTKPPIAGQVDILQIQAIDKGEPPLLSETETISIRGFPCPTTAPAVVPVEVDNSDNKNNNDNNNDNSNNNGNNNNNGGNNVAATVEAGFFDNPWNIALIALAGLLGLLLLPLLLYLCYRFCCRDACYKLKNRPLKVNRIKPNKMGGDGKGKVAQKEPERGVSEAEGEVIVAKKKAMVGGKIIRYGGYVDEYGYSYSEAGGGGGYGSGGGGGGYGYSSGGGGYGDGGESGYGGGEGVVVGDANEGKGDNGYWKEHFQDKGFKDQPSRKALPATVEKA